MFKGTAGKIAGVVSFLEDEISLFRCLISFSFTKAKSSAIFSCALAFFFSNFIKKMLKRIVLGVGVLVVVLLLFRFCDFKKQ